MISLTVSPTTVRASDCDRLGILERRECLKLEACQQDCKDALNKADAVIKDQEKVIDLYSKEIKMVRTNFEQALDHADEYKREAEFKTNLLYIVGGIALGAVVYSVVQVKR